MKKFYYAAFAAFAGLAMTSCASEDLMNENSAEGTIKMDVNISYAQLQKTRTSLAEVEGADKFANLKCTWDENDKVFVYNEAGNFLGELTMVDWEEGCESAHFNGNLQGLQGEQGERTWNFFYVPGNESAEAYSIDLSAQSGKFEDLSSHDLLSATTQVNVAGGVAYADDMGLDRHIAFAHFNLNFGDIEYNGEDITVITGQGNKADITVKNEKNVTTGDITVKQADMYFAVIPQEAAGIKFETTIDGVKYIGGIEDANTWAVNDFVNAGYQNGIEIKIDMEAAVDYKVDYILVDEEGKELADVANPFKSVTAAEKALTKAYKVGYDFDGNELKFDLSKVLNGDVEIVKFLDAEKKDVAKGAQFTLTNKAATATYYVVVKQNKYTVIVDTKGIAGSAELPNRVLPTTVNITEGGNDLGTASKDGYEFVGWSLTNDGTESNATSAVVTDVVFAIADKANAVEKDGVKTITKTVYPVWKKLIGGGTGGPITGGGWGKK